MVMRKRPHRKAVRSRIRIRIATTNDLPAMLYLEESGFGEDRFSPQQVKYLINKARSTPYVIEFEKKIAGAAIMLWRKNSSIGRLYSIVIDPKWHGKGLGSALLEECELAAEKHKCTRIMLEVRADNVRGIALYEKFGYLRAGIIKGYYFDGMNALKMIKWL